MRRPPLWATVFMLLGVAILCSLGTWQIKRLHWKEDMLARIEAQSHTDHRFKPTDLIAQNEYAQGEIEGRFLFDKEIALGPRTREGVAGYHIFTPFLLKNSETLLVNRGWVPLDYKVGTPASYGKKSVWEAGMIRTIPKPNPFVGQNDPAKNEWYRIDLAQIAQAKYLEKLAPVLLYAIDLSGDGRGLIYPDPDALTLNIPNNHKQYAIFWFSMAGVLLVVYGFRFLRKI